MARLWHMGRALAVVAIAAALVAGAGSAASGAYHRYAIPGYQTSVALPSSWKTIDYREIVKTGDLQTLARDNPELAGFFAAMAQPSSPIKLFAYDPHVASGFATNMNVVVAPVRARLTFSEYKRRLLAELQSVPGVSALHSGTVGLPGGQAVRISYRLRVNLQPRVLSVLTFQFAFFRSQRSVVFTYTTLPANARFYSSVFVTSARSIRFG
jgi:hypothetical protein